MENLRGVQRKGVGVGYNSMNILDYLKLFVRVREELGGIIQEGLLQILSKGWWFGLVVVRMSRQSQLDRYLEWRIGRFSY